MQHLVATPEDDVQVEPACQGLACAASLRAAAATVSHAKQDEISAITVVGRLGADDLHALRTVVGDIADEFECDAHVGVLGGSFSVQFTHCVLHAAGARQPTGTRWLARITPWWRTRRRRS